MKDINYLNNLTDQIIGSAIDVHKELGSGLLESAYQTCLAIELGQRDVSYKREVELAIEYKDQNVDANYRLDFIVEDCIIVEIKSVDRIIPIHEAQLLTYLRLSGKKLGLLINFNVPLLKEGIKRLIN